MGSKTGIRDRRAANLYSDDIQSFTKLMLANKPKQHNDTNIKKRAHSSTQSIRNVLPNQTYTTTRKSELQNCRSARPTKKQRTKDTLYPKLPLHESQALVVERVINKTSSKSTPTSFVLTDQQNFGKTRMASTLMSALEKAKTKKYCLSIFSSPRLKVIQELYSELGLEKPSQMLLSKAHKTLKNNLVEQGNLRDCMTHSMLKTILHGTKLKDGETPLHRFCHLLPRRTIVHFFIDELHVFIGTSTSTLKYNRMWDKLKEIEKRLGIEFRFNGLSATLCERACPSVSAFFNRVVIKEHMREDERRLYEEAMFRQPKPPKCYTVEELPSPCVDVETKHTHAYVLEKVNRLLVQYAIATTLSSQSIEQETLATSIQKKLHYYVSQVVARVATLTGKLLQTLSKMSMRRYDEKSGNLSVSAFEGYPGVLISPNSAIAANELDQYLSFECYKQFHYYDLREKKAKLGDKNSRSDQATKLREIQVNVRKQKMMNLALISKSQRASTNAFSKNFHVVVSIDGTTEQSTPNGQGMSHLKGRLGRVVPLSNEDCVAVDSVAIHFKSAWGDDMRQCFSARKHTEESIVNVLSVLNTLMQNENEYLIRAYKKETCNPTTIKNAKRQIENEVLSKAKRKELAYRRKINASNMNAKLNNHVEGDNDDGDDGDDSDDSDDGDDGDDGDDSDNSDDSDDSGDGGDVDDGGENNGSCGKSEEMHNDAPTTALQPKRGDWC